MHKSDRNREGAGATKFSDFALLSKPYTEGNPISAI